MTNLTLKIRTPREDGFTLIELTVAMGIMMLLFALAMPLYLNYQRAAKIQTIKSDVKATVVNVERYLDLSPSASAADLTDTSKVVVINTDKSTPRREVLAITGDYTNWTITAQDTQDFGAGSTYTYTSQNGCYVSSGSFGSGSSCS